VMNTQAEIVQAVRDYQSGRMGEITRTAEVV
jgi:redox-sensitive bicupin YhaK (pirin superfamily)